MKAQQLDWSDLRFVLAVCRAGTLSGAARDLGVNHSTVFRRLNLIEDKLGVRLFERLPNGYAKTTAGEEAQRSGERIENEFNILERQLSGQDLRLSGTLRVTTTDTLMLKLLGPCFAEFRQRYPGIQLELNIASASLNLSKREADVAIRPTPSPPETLIGRHLCDITTAIYGSLEYLKIHPDQPLSDHDWLAPDDSLAHIPSARWLAHTYPQARIVVWCNTLMGLLEATKSGLGVAALPCFMGDTEPQLRCISEPNEAFTTGLWLLTHADLRRTARVRTFMQFMAEIIADQYPLLERR